MIQIVNMHIYTVFTLTIKLQEILLSGCREVAMTNCFSRIYVFNLIWPNFFVQKWHNSQKNNRVRNSGKQANLHNNIVSQNSVELFHRNCDDKTPKTDRHVTMLKLTYCHIYSEFYFPHLLLKALMHQVVYRYLHENLKKSQ